MKNKIRPRKYYEMAKEDLETTRYVASVKDMGEEIRTHKVTKKSSIFASEHFI